MLRNLPPFLVQEYLSPGILRSVSRFSNTPQAFYNCRNHVPTIQFHPSELKPFRWRYTPV